MSMYNHEPRATSHEPVEFDAVAQNYSDIVDDDLSVALKGNPHEYFNQYKLYYLRKILAAQKLDHASPLKILDYGCGVGLLSQALFHEIQDITLHGFDVSEESIRNVPDELRINSNLFTSRLDDLDNDYDAALLVTVLHHVLPKSERHTVMQNIYSRLRPGGKLIIIEHNMKNPLTRKVVTHSEVDRDAIMLEPSESIKLLEASGFTGISSKYIVFFPKQLACFRFMDRYISWLPLGAQYMASGIKA